MGVHIDCLDCEDDIWICFMCYHKEETSLFDGKVDKWTEKSLKSVLKLLVRTDMSEFTIEQELIREILEPNMVASEIDKGHVYAFETTCVKKDFDNKPHTIATSISDIRHNLSLLLLALEICHDSFVVGDKIYLLMK